MGLGVHLGLCSATSLTTHIHTLSGYWELGAAWDLGALWDLGACSAASLTGDLGACHIPMWALGAEYDWGVCCIPVWVLGAEWDLGARCVPM
jgi:hypothetical protein